MSLYPTLRPICKQQAQAIMLTYRKQVARRTEKTVENALVPAQDFQKDLQVRAQKVTNALVKFTSDRQIYVEKTVGILQKVSPYPIL